MERRGFFTSLVTSGIFVAWLCAVGASTAVSYLSPDDLVAWGWRLPFLASFVLVLIGLWMRMKIEESAVFVKAIDRKAPARVPFIELMRTDWKPWVIVLFAAMAESASGFFFLVFASAMRSPKLKIPPTTLLQSLLIGNTNRTDPRSRIRRLVGPNWAPRHAFRRLYHRGDLYCDCILPMLESGNTLLIYLAMIIPVSLSRLCR